MHLKPLNDSEFNLKLFLLNSATMLCNVTGRSYSSGTDGDIATQSLSSTRMAMLNSLVKGRSDTNPVYYVSSLSFILRLPFMLSFMLRLQFTLQAFYAGITINVVFDNSWTHGWLPCRPLHSKISSCDFNAKNYLVFIVIGHANTGGGDT